MEKTEFLKELDSKFMSVEKATESLNLITEQNATVKALSDKLDEYIKGVENGAFGKKEEIEEAKWFKNLIITKAAGDITDTGTAATIVPTKIHDKIVEKLAEYSFVRDIVTVYTTPEKKGTVPAENSGFTAARVAENTAATEGIFKYTAVTYDLYPIKVATLVSNKLIKVATPKLLEVLWRGFGKAFGKLEMTEFITGDNANEMMGLDNASITTVNAAAGHTSISAITRDDVTKLVTGLNKQYRKDACLICSPEFEAQLLALRKDNEYSFYDLITEKLFGKYPVYTNSNVTTSGVTNPVAYFGNFENYFLFEDEKMKARISDQGYTLVSTDKFFMLMSNWTDGKIILTEAFKGLKLVS